MRRPILIPRVICSFTLFSVTLLPFWTHTFATVFSPTCSTASYLQVDCVSVAQARSPLCSGCPCMRVQGAHAEPAFIDRTYKNSVGPVVLLA